MRYNGGYVRAGVLSFFHLLGIDVDSNIYVRSLVVLCLDIFSDKLSTSTVRGAWRGGIGFVK